MAEAIDLEGLGRCEVPPGVDMAKLARGWAFTLKGVCKALVGLVGAAEEILREQRRMRRRAARRGTRGRRGARAVGPWGVAWPMCSTTPITLDEAADLERGVMVEIDAPRDPFPDCPHGGHGGRLNESVLYCETCLKSEEAPHG